MFSNFFYEKLNKVIDFNDRIYLKNQNVNFMLEMIKSDFIHNNKTIFVVLPTLYFGP